MRNAGPAQCTWALAACPGVPGDTGTSLEDAHRPLQQVLLSITVEAEGCKIRASSGNGGGVENGEGGGANTVQAEERHIDASEHGMKTITRES